MNLKKFAFISVLFMSSAILLQANTAKPGIHKAPSKTELWYQNLFFKNADLNFETLGVIGVTYSQGADIGESASAARKVNPQKIITWYNAWKNLGERLKASADKYIKEGHVQSAETAYFRACTYLWKSGFYLIGTKDSEKAVKVYREAVDCFRKAIADMPNIKPVNIPYKGSSLPGYLLISQNSDKAKPVLIVHSGFDGTKEITFFEVGRAALSRGYNCLIFDGPGQGEAVWGSDLHFLPNWELPVKAVIDFLENYKEIKISRIALMGRSMGGYLAPRAAAFDKRIDACIANGGIYDFAAPMLNNFPPAMLKLLKNNPEAFNKVMNDYLKKGKSIETDWFFNNGMWAFGLKTPAEFLTKLQEYTLKGLVDKITCPTLIVNSTHDMFTGNQAKILFKKLKCKKTYMVFGDNDEGELHCQLGAVAVSNERIFNWLDETFNFNINKQ